MARDRGDATCGGGRGGDRERRDRAMKSGLYALLVVRVVCLQAALMGREPRYTRVVTLKQGNVQGRVVRPKRNAHVADVEVYLGIPYAAPPVGNLRFMPPGEPPQWSDTLEAVRAKPVCPQMLPDAAEKGGGRRASVERDAFVRRMRQYLRNESEDCLYLNIYVPHPQRREYGTYATTPSFVVTIRYDRVRTADCGLRSE